MKEIVLRYLFYSGISIISALCFMLWPELDILLSSLFFDGKSFYITNYWAKNIDRLILILGFSEALILSALCLLLITRQNLLRQGKILQLRKIILALDYQAPKRFIFIGVACFIGPFLSVYLSKWFFGRARPFQTSYFTGDALFTPAFTISDACAQSCSFVSGHSAIGFLFYVFYFAYRDTNQKISNFFFWLGTSLGTFFGLTRVLSGNHFLSDIFMSGLLVYGTAMIMYDLCWRNTSRKLPAIP